MRYEAIYCLDDFLRAGGIFKPIEIESENCFFKDVRGELKFNNETYDLTVRMSRFGHNRILEDSDSDERFSFGKHVENLYSAENNVFAFILLRLLAVAFLWILKAFDLVLCVLNVSFFALSRITPAKFGLQLLINILFFLSLCIFGLFTDCIGNRGDDCNYWNISDRLQRCSMLIT